MWRSGHHFVPRVVPRSILPAVRSPVGAPSDQGLAALASNFEPTHSQCVALVFESSEWALPSGCGGWDAVGRVLTSSRSGSALPRQTEAFVVCGLAVADVVMAGVSGRQAVQVDGIPPPPVGRADPIPD